MDFDPLISDIHNAISFTCIVTQSDSNLLSSSNSANRNDEDQTFTRAVWNANVLNDFKREIDAKQIHQESNDLDLLLQGQTENIYMEERVIEVCGRVSKILVSAAEKSGMIMTKTVKLKGNMKRFSQACFNDECGRVNLKEIMKASL